MKKVFAILLTLVVLAACAIPAISAETTEPTYIYFAVPTEGGVAWNNFSTVYCHIWSKTDGDVYGWQEKNERCEDMGNGYWRYDMSAISFSADGEYSLIFSNENGMQTYNLNVTSSCLGDIAYCDGTSVANPVDGEKSCAVAHWTNAENVHPAVEIDSNGHTINVDDVDTDSTETVWGDGTGNSYELAVLTATSATTADDESNTEAISDDNADDSELVIAPAPTENVDGLNTTAVTTWIIVISAVLALAIFVVVFILAKRNKDIQDGKK